MRSSWSAPRPPAAGGELLVATWRAACETQLAALLCSYALKLSCKMSSTLSRLRCEKKAVARLRACLRYQVRVAAA
jgi:hypothetical protein